MSLNFRAHRKKMSSLFLATAKSEPKVGGDVIGLEFEDCVGTEDMSRNICEIEDTKYLGMREYLPFFLLIECAHTHYDI